MADELRGLAEVLDEHQLNSSGECSCDGTFRPDDIQAQHQIDALQPMLREHVAKAVLRHDASVRADEIKRRTRTEALVRDIADHGLRADLNPTVTSAMDGGGTYRELTAYLRNLDSRLRKRAQAALDGSETP